MVGTAVAVYHFTALCAKAMLAHTMHVFSRTYRSRNHAVPGNTEKKHMQLDLE